MNIQFRYYIILGFILMSSSSCERDGLRPIVNLRTNCIISSDTINISGKSSFSAYQFEKNSGRLTIAKKIAPNGVVLNYREVHYVGGEKPGKTVTYLNANEYYETRFNYFTGSSLPYKAERFFTSKLNGRVTKVLCSFHFHYDDHNKLQKVVYETPITGDEEYTLTIFYNDQDNVTLLEYQINKGVAQKKQVISVNAFDDRPNPYCNIPNWKFLMLNDEWHSEQPEPIITALSKNNPLGYSTVDFTREMTYTYNHNGLPASRLNTDIHRNVQSAFKESFTYYCP